MLNIVPQTHNKNNSNVFTLIKTYDTYKYDNYVVTCQSRNFNKQFNYFKDRFPNMVVLMN